MVLDSLAAPDGGNLTLEQQFMSFREQVNTDMHGQLGELRKDVHEVKLHCVQYSKVNRALTS